jgi:hypothetical protein
MYARLNGPILGEVVINLGCLARGPFLLAYSWRLRRILPSR